LELFVLGGMPRTLRARKVLRDLERGMVSYVDAFRVLLEESVELMWYQLGAGLSTVADPMIDWHDIFRPFVESWRGCYVDGLARFFDNNFFYRVPVFVELPTPARTILRSRVLAFVERLPSWAKLKVSVPGPLTLVKMARISEGIDTDSLLEEVARILSNEAREAIEAGARVIEVHEPWLSDADAKRDDAELALDLFNKHFSGLGVETVLATYFQPPSREVWEELCSSRASYVSIDVVDNPRRAREVLEKCVPEGLALGVVQARDLVDPPIDEVKSLVKLCRSAKKLALTTSSGLDLLPIDAALEKTRLLAKLGEVLSHEL